MVIFEALYSFRESMQLLYTGLFTSLVIFALHHLHMVSPRLEFAQTKISLKRDNISIEIRLISNSPADNEGERSEKKNGSEYFPV